MSKIRFYPVTEEGELYPYPVPAVQALPNWYKDMPRRQEGAASSSLFTARECSPMFDAMTAGYMITLPCDVEVIYQGGDLSVDWKTGHKLLEVHGQAQHPGMPNLAGANASNVLKWVNHFTMETEPGYSTLFTHPINRDELPFRIFSGVVDTDRYTMAVNFPFRFLPMPEGSMVMEAGTPIAQAIPFRRDSFESERLPYDKKAYSRKSYELFRKIRHSYRTQYWVKKRYR